MVPTIRYPRIAIRTVGRTYPVGGSYVDAVRRALAVRLPRWGLPRWITSPGSRVACGPRDCRCAPARWRRRRDRPTGDARQRATLSRSRRATAASATAGHLLGAVHPVVRLRWPPTVPAVHVGAEQVDWMGTSVCRRRVGPPSESGGISQARLGDDGTLRVDGVEAALAQAGARASGRQPTASASRVATEHSRDPARRVSQVLTAVAWSR